MYSALKFRHKKKDLCHVAKLWWDDIIFLKFNSAIQRQDVFLLEFCMSCLVLRQGSSTVSVNTFLPPMLHPSSIGGRNASPLGSQLGFMSPPKRGSYFYAADFSSKNSKP
jgi:hypothetical protein